MVFLNLQIAQIAQGLTDYGFVSGDGGVGVIFSDTEPATPEDAQLWLSSLTNELKIFNGVSWQYVSLTVAEKAALASLTTAVLDAQLAADEAEAARDTILTMTVATGAEGSAVTWNSTTGILTVPVGDTGLTGKGIVSVIRTTGDGSAGTTDIYTITYSDATTSTFNVYNGADVTNVTVINDSTITTTNTWSASKINTAKADKAQTITTTTVYTDNTTATTYKMYMDNGNITMEEL